jgi:hypothetical protein
MEDITYLMAFLLFIGGAFANLLLDSSERNVDSPSTPKKFDPIFLLTDNWKRLALVLILAFMFPILAPESGFEMTKLNLAGAGFFHDRIIQTLKSKYKGLQVNRN